MCTFTTVTLHSLSEKGLQLMKSQSRDCLARKPLWPTIKLKLDTVQRLKRALCSVQWYTVVGNRELLHLRLFVPNFLACNAW